MQVCTEYQYTQVQRVRLGDSEIQREWKKTKELVSEREIYVKTLAYVFIRNSIRKFCQKEWEKIRFKVFTQSTDRNRISIDLRDSFFLIPRRPPRLDKFSSIHNTYNIIYYGLISDQTPRDVSHCVLYFIGILLGISYILYHLRSRRRQ